MKPLNILLQTTIAPDETDWHIGYFSMLRDYLASQRAEDGSSLFNVIARDRIAIGEPDPVLSTIDTSDFDELWLFAVDVGNGLEPADIEAINRFQRRGGGVLMTRDHMNLGCSVCSVERIGAAHLFHTHNVDPEYPTREPDDRGTPAILWPNFHSGANGDYQEIAAHGRLHPVLRNPDAAEGIVRYLPSHPHEGAVAAPKNDHDARVIATGTSKWTGAVFNIAVAFEPTETYGPAIAQSTFHHFANHNWDGTTAHPDFVTEKPGNGLLTNAEAMQSVHRYVRNLALWLGGRLEF